MRIVLVVLCAAATLSGVAVGLAPAGSSGRVDLTQARAQPCTRVGIATGVMAFVGLLEERRFYATRLLWLPRARVRFYAYVLHVLANGRLLRTKSGADVPTLTQDWLSTGGSLSEVVWIDPRVDWQEPRKSAFAVGWIRKAPDGSSVVIGVAKGLWDCEKRRIGRFVGGERAVDSEEEARAEAAGRCGRRGSTTFRRYGQLAALCRLPRGASG